MSYFECCLGSLLSWMDDEESWFVGWRAKNFIVVDLQLELN